MDIANIVRPVVVDAAGRSILRRLFDLHRFHHVLQSRYPCGCLAGPVAIARAGGPSRASRGVPEARRILSQEL
jgi:hypothetical protein